MDQQTFKALWVEETAEGKYTRRVVERKIEDLPQGEVLVRVRYSSLNYKDALSASGSRGVTRHYPHTPGIDAAGEVVTSESAHFQPGDLVIAAATGDQGVSIPGGYGQYLRARTEWLTRLPSGMTLRESMGYGTAGLTAAYSIDRLQWAGVRPEDGEILVTGATGGVGTVATGILARLGYRVAAATGKPHEAGLLKSLGAEQIVQRDEVNDESGKALLSGRWAGVVDTVGGNYLATAVRSTQPGGAVTTCGNTAGAELSLTVFPFILRGVNLLGIDASKLTKEIRERMWNHLATDWKVEQMEELIHEVALEGLDAEIQKILRGGQVGRVVVRLD